MALCFICPLPFCQEKTHATCGCAGQYEGKKRRGERQGLLLFQHPRYMLSTGGGVGPSLAAPSFVHGPMRDPGSTDLCGLLTLLCIFVCRDRNSSLLRNNFLWWPRICCEQQLYFKTTFFRWFYNSPSGFLRCVLSSGCSVALLGGIMFFTHLL